jgi:hypothetical protein
MRGPDHRKTVRRTLHYSATVEDNVGAELCKCTLSDISEGGAKTRLHTPAEVPDRFVLRLSEQGSLRRVCQIVWRNGDDIGIAFVKTIDPT